jgi:hypothetical protein
MQHTFDKSLHSAATTRSQVVQELHRFAQARSKHRDSKAAVTILDADRHRGRIVITARSVRIGLNSNSLPITKPPRRQPSQRTSPRVQQPRDRPWHRCRSLLAKCRPECLGPRRSQTVWKQPRHRSALQTDRVRLWSPSCFQNPLPTESEEDVDVDALAPDRGQNPTPGQ